MKKTKKKYPLTVNNYKYILKNYRHNLIGFIEDVLQFHKLEDWQRDLCNNIMNNESDIAVKSCTGSGKSSLMSCVSLWKILLFDDSRVVVTSASYGQLCSGFIYAISKIIEDSLIPSWFNATQKRVSIPGIVGNEIVYVNWTINQYERLQGTHPKHLLWVADESSSYPNGIFEAMDGNLQTDFSQQVLISNPTRKEGKIYEIFTTTNDWVKITISAHNVPHISQKWINKQINNYGANSDQVKIRVDGEFPESSIGSFIMEVNITEAIERYNPNVTRYDPFQPIIGGLDIADTGDETVLAIRQGDIIKYEYIKCDIDNLALEVIPLLIKYNIGNLYVDSNGVGRTTYKKLLKLRENVFPVVFGKCSADELSCSNKRTLYWYRFKEWLKTGHFVTNERSKVVRQAASLLYSYDDLNRYNLENKDVAKSRRGVKSPDIIDAAAYTFCEEEEEEIEETVWEPIPTTTQTGSLI